MFSGELVVVYERAPGICKALTLIVSNLEEFSNIRLEKVYCVRSYKARTRAIARIYGLPRPWIVAGLEPGYVIEVVSERFYSLPCRERVGVLIHELLHIPRGFTGGLRKHGELVNSRVERRLLSKLDKKIILEACKAVEQ